MPTLVPIVEGHSEVQSIRILIERIWAAENIYGLTIEKPHRIPRNKIVKPNELERRIDYIENYLGNPGAILLLLDADDDNGFELENVLTMRGRKVSRGLFGVGIAEKEYECWFLGAKTSLRGFGGIRSDAKIPDQPEAIRGAKHRLTSNMEKNASYNEVDDQPSFTSRFDMQLCRKNCPSFGRFYNLILTLSNQLKACES